jgi:hypothetical protein
MDQIDVSRSASSEAMPRGIRRAVFATVGLLLAGALYLIVVRGEAMLLDLQALGTKVWCF